MKTIMGHKITLTKSISPIMSEKINPIKRYINIDNIYYTV